MNTDERIKLAEKKKKFNFCKYLEYEKGYEFLGRTHPENKIRDEYKLDGRRIVIEINKQANQIVHLYEGAELKSSCAFPRTIEQAKFLLS